MSQKSSPLHPYPGTSSRIESLSVQATWLSDGTLRLSYRLVEAQARLVLQAPRQAAFTDGLWQHTCLEAFAARPNEAAYREFNFSPSGEWAVYAFKSYRDRDPLFVPAATPDLHVSHSDGALSIDVLIPSVLLPRPSSKGQELGLSAVIEDETGLSYWALAHPADRPDFHHRSGFCLSVFPDTTP